MNLAEYVVPNSSQAWTSWEAVRWNDGQTALRAVLVEGLLQRKARSTTPTLAEKHDIKPLDKGPKCRQLMQAKYASSRRRQL